MKLMIRSLLVVVFIATCGVAYWLLREVDEDKIILDMRESGQLLGQQANEVQSCFQELSQQDVKACNGDGLCEKIANINFSRSCLSAFAFRKPESVLNVCTSMPGAVKEKYCSAASTLCNDRFFIDSIRGKTCGDLMGAGEQIILTEDGQTQKREIKKEGLLSRANHYIQSFTMGAKAPAQTTSAPALGKSNSAF